jgi:Ser/Thr protein kinase RdoA (MazF antagonist)
MMPDPKNGANQPSILNTRPPDFSTGGVLEFARDLYGLTGNLSPLNSERDQNYRLETLTGEGFVIKISNSAMDPAVLSMQVQAMEHIAKVDPELPVPRVLKSRNGTTLERIQAGDGLSHLVHVLTYLPGVYPKDDPTYRALLRPVGACLARLTLALRGFHHPAANYELLWDLKQSVKLKDYLHHIPDPGHHQLASYFLDRFERHVLPEIPKLRSQIIHNDFAPNNMLVACDDPGVIVGIIDFGDLIYSPLVTDLATTISQILIEQDDPVGIAGEIIAAYHEVIPLEPAELSLLYDLIATRLTMLNVIGAWRVTLYPENKDYIAGYLGEVWDTLAAWRLLDPAEVTRRFFRACGYWELEDLDPPPKAPKETRRAHLERRDRLLGSLAFLFYDRPLHIVRGEGVWLYDDDGSRYLDVYNNVPHVGHCHPHVVKAISDQARVLNIGTRYMHGLILELAERITCRIPEPLSARSHTTAAGMPPSGSAPKPPRKGSCHPTWRPFTRRSRTPLSGYPLRALRMRSRPWRTGATARPC